MAHRNIPIFIPHLGCPNQCVFCNQRSISGCHSFSEDHVTEQIEQALSTIRPQDEAQIAFFGGSFTGIDRGLMLRLLEVAERYVKEGRVTGIRLSTRPDYISPEILDVLSRYSVQVIELGLQSMDDGVLRACQRGHTAKQAENACRMVTKHGFSLVGQMMIGLPEASPESEIETAEQICRLGASAARIYPTVVFYDTPLCEMTRTGRYHPLSLDDAVRRSAAVLRVFQRYHVPCIRIGLCAGEELTSPQTVMEGPNHPALGEMVLSECAYLELLSALEKQGMLGETVNLRVPERKVSQTVGQHRRNLARLERETGTVVRRVIADAELEEILPQPWQNA